MTRPSFAAERGRLQEISTDIAGAGANQPHAAAAVDRWDRQTDGRTPDRYIDYTMRVASIRHWLLIEEAKRQLYAG